MLCFAISDMKAVQLYQCPVLDGPYHCYVTLCLFTFDFIKILKALVSKRKLIYIYVHTLIYI